MDNLIEVMSRLELATDYDIFVSTSAPLRELEFFLNMHPDIILDISMHATNSNTRNKLMPINYKNPIEEVVSLVLSHENDANLKRIVFTYLLFDGINDSDSDCARLIELFKNRNVFVELKEYNEIPSIKYKKTPSARINFIHDKLLANGVNCYIEKSIGIDIAAGCGQLRANYIESIGG